MPELPDVEGFKRYYARYAAGHLVDGVVVPAPAIARNSTPQGLGAAVQGSLLERPRRHGKWMLAPTRPTTARSGGGPALAFHFGMTGFFRFCRDAAEPRHRHDRLILRVDDGELRYRNMRMLGGVWLLRAGEELEAVAGPLGPDAAALDRDGFDSILAAGRGSLKALLMNQRRIAGIGNELSDEVLWRARLHPRRPVHSLRRPERSRLYAALADVIAISNRHGRIPTSAGWLKSQRGAHDPRCPRCHGAVRRSKVAGRTAYWCPRCQRA
jgi:formamidopyrimidine-DNA glycosylase